MITCLTHILSRLQHAEFSQSSVRVGVAWLWDAHWTKIQPLFVFSDFRHTHHFTFHLKVHKLNWPLARLVAPIS